MDEKRNGPVALSGAHRAADIKALAGASDGSESIAYGLSFQAAHVAARYRLNPCIARLVCFLADIGGRLS